MRLSHRRKEALHYFFTLILPTDSKKTFIGEIFLSRSPRRRNAFCFKIRIYLTIDPPFFQERGGGQLLSRLKWRIFDQSECSKFLILNRKLIANLLLLLIGVAILKYIPKGGGQLLSRSRNPPKTTAFSICFFFQRGNEINEKKNWFSSIFWKLISKNLQTVPVYINGAAYFRHQRFLREKIMKQKLNKHFLYFGVLFLHNWQ